MRKRLLFTGHGVTYFARSDGRLSFTTGEAQMGHDITAYTGSIVPDDLLSVASLEEQGYSCEPAIRFIRTILEKLTPERDGCYIEFG